jgi:predicted phosphodiesterase
MKIGIFQDIHANLPAFASSMAFFKTQACTLVYHVGDLVGIGPYPKEVMESASMIPNLKFVMGNHDYWYAYGVPEPKPAYMSEEEAEHHNWTQMQIGETYREFVKGWAYNECLDYGEGCRIVFQHYALEEGTDKFRAIIQTPNAPDLDQLFEGIKADYVFYGHQHLASDVQGKSRYVNLGSAGCFDHALARVGILEVDSGGLSLKQYSVPYDDNGLLEAFEEKEVPARDLIKKVFIVRE